MTTTTAYTTLTDLSAADKGSFYTIRGAGGDLADWVDGLTTALTEAGIGTPTAWYTTTGAAVNAYAGRPANPFQPDLTFLMFPLDGLHVGKLAMFRLRMEDTWFDDMIANMRPVGLGDDE